MTTFNIQLGKINLTNLMFFLTSILAVTMAQSAGEQVQRLADPVDSTKYCIVAPIEWRMCDSIVIRNITAYCDLRACYTTGITKYQSCTYTEAEVEEVQIHKNDEICAIIDQQTELNGRLVKVHPCKPIGEGECRGYSYSCTIQYYDEKCHDVFSARSSDEEHTLEMTKVIQLAYITRPTVTPHVKCEHEITDDYFYINCNHSTTVHLQKELWTIIERTPAGPKKFKYPRAVRAKSGELVASIFYGPDLVLTYKGQILGHSECIYIDCYLCAEAFDNWSCLPTGAKVAIAFMLLTMLILSGLLLWWLYPIMLVGKAAGRFSLSLLYRTWLLVSWPFKKCCGRKSRKRGYSKVKDEEDDRDVQTRARGMSDKRIEEGSKRRKSVHHRDNIASQESSSISMGSFTKSIFFGTVMLPMVLGCDRSTIVPVKYEQCTQLEDQLICTTMVSTSLTVPYVGGETCLVLYDQDANSLLGEVKVTFQRLEQWRDLNYMYSTSRWKGVYNSHFKCAKTPGCPGDCNMVKPDDMSCLGHLEGESTDLFMGESKCIRKCSGWKCDCFHEIDGCEFTRWAIQPTDAWWNVYDMGSAHNIPVISIVTTGVDPPVNVQKGWTPGQTDTLGIFNVRLDGVYAHGRANPRPYRLVLKPDDMSLFCTVSEINQPQRGTIGEIQMDATDAFKYSYSRALVSEAQLTKSTKYSFSEDAIGMDPSARPDCHKLPYLHDGVVWKMNDGALYTEESDASGAVITLETNKEIVVRRKVAQICPVFEVLSASGCSSCSEGVSVMVEAYSSCAEGLAYVSADSGVRVNNQAIKLFKDKNRYRININVHQVYNDFELCMSDGGRKGCHEVNVTAPQKSSLDPGGWVDGRGNDTDDSSLGAGISSVAKFISSILLSPSGWGWIITVVLWILIFIAMVQCGVFNAVFKLISAFIGSIKKAGKSLVGSMRKKQA